MSPKIFTKALLFLTLAFVFSCERDWNNPWDGMASLDPDSWAPQNLAIEDVSITEKKLTWTYTGDDRFEGFKLDRKAGNAEWQEAYQVLPKEARNWTDSQVIPDPSLTYSYRVYAFAGKYSSAEKTSSVAVEFPAPANVQIEKLTDKSYKLTWSDNSTGEQGFKIDRKIDEGNWVTAFGTVAANQTSFIDTNVLRATSVEYRVYGFYESYESSKTTIATSAELAAPTDLQIEKLSDKSFRLSWTDNSDGEEGYKIDRKVDNGDWVPAYGIVAPNQFSYVDTNVFRTVNIEYQVYAFAGNAESQKIVANTNAELTAPTNLAIIQNSITIVTLNWQDNSTGEDGFRIDRKYAGGNWQLLTTTKNNQFEDNDFELNTQVYYRVSAFVGQYNSSFIEKDFDAFIPTPSNLVITKFSDKSYMLSWDDNSNGEQGFKIDRRTDNGEWLNEYGSTFANQKSFIDTNVFRSVNVEYRIYTFFEGYNSSKIHTNTNAELTAPSNLQLTSNTITAISLIWNDNSNGEDGFKLERKHQGGTWEQIALTTTNNFLDSNFQLNTQVYYRVCAYVGQYNSSYAEKTFNSAIPVPSNLLITSNTITSVTISWQDNSIGEDGFKLERKHEGGTWEIIATTTTSNFLDSNFQLNTQVYYRVCAYVGQYNSSYTEKTFNSAIPVPSNLLITSNTITSVTISWQDNSIGEDGFKLERKHEGSTWEQIALTTTNNYQDNNFQLNTQVYYRVCVYVGQYNSSYVEKSFNSSIPAPSNLQLTPNSVTSITLSWHDNSNGEEGFKIDRRINSGAWELNYAMVGRNQLSYSDENVDWQTNNYTYRVYAFLGQYNSISTESSITWPVVTTTAASNITNNSATTGGMILMNGNYLINLRGVCYGMSQNPDLSGLHTVNGSGYGSFNSYISGLEAITLYYVNAYAVTIFDTIFGNQISFTTTAELPVVTTANISNITSTSATGGGEVINEGTFPVTDRGVCWSSSSNPSIYGPHTNDGSGIGSFNSLLTGLNSSTLYYVRAYATSSAGTSYGNQLSFTSAMFSIGQNYGGGIIFYINGTGQHGLIAAQSDQSTNAEWGCYGTTIGGTLTTIGSGESNTTKIVNNCSESGIAARICSELVLNGYSDWFLPSKDELNLMYVNLKLAGIGGFADFSYWSSSEATDVSAWVQWFNSGNQGHGNKGWISNVRAVRDF